MNLIIKACRHKISTYKIDISKSKGKLKIMRDNNVDDQVTHAIIITRRMTEV